MGGQLCSFGAALRACGALPRAPACWERTANRVVTPSHAEAFGTPSFVGRRCMSPYAGQPRRGLRHSEFRRKTVHESTGWPATTECLPRTESPQCVSGTDWSRQETKLGVPKASAWLGVTTRLAVRSQQAGARGRAPQARSAAPNEHTTPPVTGQFIQSAPKHHKTPPQIGTFA